MEKKYSKFVGYKIYIQKSVAFIYTKNRISKRETEGWDLWQFMLFLLNGD